MEIKRLEKLKAQKDKLEARIKAVEAKTKTRERKLDTRRKILLGALLQEWMAKDDALKNKVLASLEKFLTKKIDRNLFDLSERKDPGAPPNA